MNDRDLMENMLCLQKGVCDLLMHGTIESATPEVHRAFSQALDCALGMQDDIYSKMQSRGWYAPEQAAQDKLQSVRMKFIAKA